MTDTSGHERLWAGAGLCLAAALLVTALAEAAAIRYSSIPLAVATVLWYGAVFAALAWYRLPLALIGLVVALPLITVEVGFGDVEKTLSTDKVALAGVLGVWLLRRGRTAWPRLWATPAGRWWLVFLAVVLLSGLRNGATIAEGWGVMKQGVYAGLFLMALDILGADPVLPRRAVVAATFAATGVAVLSIVEWSFWIAGLRASFYFKKQTVMDEVVAGSTIGHVNYLGGYLILLLPILMALACSSKKTLRTLFVGGAVLSGLALLYTKSIGAWSGLAGGSILGWVLSLRRSLVPKGARIGLGLACMAGLLAAAGVGIVKLRQDVLPLSLRLAVHQVGLAAVAERPFLGFGTNAYQREHLRLERTIFGRELVEFREVGARLSAHSTFLDVAVERGLLGLAAFAGLLATVLRSGIRGCLGATDPGRRILLLGLVCGLSGFVVQAFTENLFSYSKVAAIFWILAGALVSLSEPTPARR